MICFAVAWMFLLLEYENTYKQCVQRLPFVGIVCFILLMQIAQPAYTKLNAQADNYFEKGNPAFAKVALTDDQLDYLNNVADIMIKHGYKKDSSIVFTTEYDWATVYALDAKLSSNFYQKRNFLFFPKEDMLKPDFVFMCDWDKMEIGKELQNMPWGWPQEFDSIYVGSPEGKDFPWDSNRWLYYRK